MSEQIEEHLTHYALSKQIYNGITIQTNYGEIQITEKEEEKLKNFLEKMLQKRISSNKV